MKMKPLVAAIRFRKKNHVKYSQLRVEINDS